MLTVLLRLVGIDLDARIVQVKHHLDGLALRATDQIKREVRDVGITLALVFAGIVALLGAGVIGLIGLYWWIDQHNGPYVALATIGATVTVIAILLLAIAAMRGGKSRPVAPLPETVVVPVESVTTSVVTVSPTMSTMSDLPPLNIASVIPPPASNSLLDQLTHRVSLHAASVSDEALAAATNVMTNGSRGQILGTLALVAIVGLAVGRHRR